MEEDSSRDSNGSGRNLHPLLISSIERPLNHQALQETKGINTALNCLFEPNPAENPRSHIPSTIVLSQYGRVYRCILPTPYNWGLR